LACQEFWKFSTFSLRELPPSESRKFSENELVGGFNHVKNNLDHETPRFGVKIPKIFENIYHPEFGIFTLPIWIHWYINPQNITG